MRSSVVVVLLCVAVATAFPMKLQQQHVAAAKASSSSSTVVGDAPGVYQAPAPGACRSPCPALNTLANHGFLPRDGKNIDEAILKKALIDTYGLSWLFGSTFAKVATKKFAVSKTFSLCDTLKSDHNNNAPPSSGIEHLASLTRLDRLKWGTEADNTQIKPDANQVNIVLNSSKDRQMITLTDFVRARQQLWAKTFATNPAHKNDPLIKKEKIVAAVEGCLLLGVLSGDSGKKKYQISSAYAKSFMLDERFPAGWKKNSFFMGFGIPNVISCVTQQGLVGLEDQVRQIMYEYFGF
jgi:hypothetical protein